VVIDLSLGPRYAFILRLLGITQLFGFNYKKRGRFLSASLPIDGYHKKHVIAYMQNLLAFIGIRMLEPYSKLHVSQETKGWAGNWIREHIKEGSGPIVGMIPAGGVSWGNHASFRRWSYHGFAEVADHLVASAKATILFFGEPSDAGACATVKGYMQHTSIDVSGKTNLEQFVALANRAAL